MVERKRILVIMFAQNIIKRGIDGRKTQKDIGMNLPILYTKFV